MHRCNLHRWNVNLNLECRSLLRERTQGDRKPDKPRMRYGARSLLYRKPDKPRMRYGLVGHERRGMSHETSGRASEFYSKRTFASIRCLPSAAGSSEWLHTVSKSAYPDSPFFTRSIPTIASLERCDPFFCIAVYLVRFGDHSSARQLCMTSGSLGSGWTLCVY